MARKKIESTIGADFLNIGKESRSEKIERALQLSPKAPEDPEAAAAPLVSIQIRLPQDTREQLQEMAVAEGQLLAVYMRGVLMAVADPATDPELAEQIRRIELDRPRNPQVLKQRISKGHAGQLVGGNNIRVPQNTRDKLQEMTARKGLTLSLYLRYIFISLADRAAGQDPEQ